MECGMAWKVLNIFSSQWQSLKGVNYSIWIAFLTFLNKNPNVAKNRDVIEKNWVEKNWVHFSIQQPRNIPNQFTDLKQLKKTFFFVYQCYTSIWWTSAQPRSSTSSSFRGEQFSWNFIRWRHRACSTVVQLFCKRSQIKFSSQHFRKWDHFSFNQDADRTIRTEWNS